MTRVPYNQPYSVTVAQQPLNYLCDISNGAGLIDGHIQDVQVNCSARTYTISGTFSGLQDNFSFITIKLDDGVEFKDLYQANGQFTFNTVKPFGSVYTVEMEALPISGQYLCVIEQDTGLVLNNVNDIHISCNYYPTLSPTISPSLTPPTNLPTFTPGNCEIYWAARINTGLMSNYTWSRATFGNHEDCCIYCQQNRQDCDGP
eukprot:UN31265